MFAAPRRPSTATPNARGATVPNIKHTQSKKETTYARGHKPAAVPAPAGAPLSSAPPEERERQLCRREREIEALLAAAGEPSRLSERSLVGLLLYALSTESLDPIHGILIEAHDELDALVSMPWSDAPEGMRDVLAQINRRVEVVLELLSRQYAARAVAASRGAR